LARGPGLGVGDAAPPFRLPDQNGNVIDSADLLAKGPLVVVLFRGHW
jgi:peroxiredoxin